MATKDAALNGASNSFNPSLYSLFTYADAPGLVHPLPITREWKTPDFTFTPNSPGDDIYYCQVRTYG